MHRFEMIGILKEPWYRRTKSGVGGEGMKDGRFLLLVHDVRGRGWRLDAPMSLMRSGLGFVGC